MRRDYGTVDSRSGIHVLLAACVLAALWWPAPAHAQCSQEVTAVMLVSGIYPGTDLEAQLLSIGRRGAPSSLSEDQLLAAVQTVYANSIYAPYAPSLHHERTGVAGHFALYCADPSDFGAATFIDMDTGEVAFAGAM